ncbi:MAG: hypothetical protein WA208_19985 [Thermoanaerobaculia bacterium]
MSGAGQPERDRRKVQRVRLPQPLRAAVGTQKVFILDISIEGLRIVQQEPLGGRGTKCSLRFEWQGMRAFLDCEVVHVSTHKVGEGISARTLHHSGMSIANATPESRAIVRGVIEEQILRALDEQRANARGIPAVAALSFQTGKGSAYVRHELAAGRWSAHPTTDPRQPASGFTISSDQTFEEVNMLRSAYESGDASGRALIREMSELSISKSEGIPTRKYEP